MRMSRNGFIIYFVISLKPDRPYKATVVYNFATVVYSDIPRQTVVYISCIPQLKAHIYIYTTAQGSYIYVTLCVGDIKALSCGIQLIYILPHALP